MRLVTWVKSKLRIGIEHNPYYGLFKGWHSNAYTAVSPGRMYGLRIKQGFLGFKDHGDYDKELLVSAPFWQKRLIWKALMHDLHTNNVAGLKADAIENVEDFGDNV